MKPAAQLTKQQQLVIGGVTLFAILLILIAIFFNWQKTVEQEQPPIDAPTTAITIRSTGDNAPLEPAQPIDQEQLSIALQSAWTDALQNARQNVANFPHDPNLIAFQIQTPDQTEPTSFVVYAHLPIIVETKLDESITSAQKYQLDFDQDNYQLVVRFSHTSELETLDLSQVLTETFNQILNHRRLPEDQLNNPITTDAFVE